MSDHGEYENAEGGDMTQINGQDANTTETTQHVPNGDVKNYGNNRDNERELASVVLVIQNKRYYLDIKQNAYGKFVKLAQVVPQRPKQRIVFSMDKVVEFRNTLTEFGEYYASLGPPQENNGERDQQPGGEILKNKMIMGRNRKYWLDLKETNRNRILKVSQIMSPSNTRSVIVIPAQGIIELRNELTHLIDEYATEEDLRPSEVKTANMRLGNRRIHFETRANQRGRYLRISETRNNQQTNSFVVPENALDRFKEVLDSMIEDMKLTAIAGDTHKDKTAAARNNGGALSTETHHGVENASSDVAPDTVGADNLNAAYNGTY